MRARRDVLNAKDQISTAFVGEGYAISQQLAIIEIVPGFLEFRHESHASGEIEAPRVVAAADVIGGAGRLDQDIPAMGADIRQATQGAVGVRVAQLR